jgi:YfiH family protein
MKAVSVLRYRESGDSWDSWHRPENVRFHVTNRIGGASASPYDSFNLAGHVGDLAKSVRANRESLKKFLSLEHSPIWLEQIHSTEILSIGANKSGIDLPQADGAYTTELQRPLVVMTADCMPILICSRDGQEIAAVHAGWRGLASGIIERAVNKFSSDKLLVYLGPTIDVCHYEIGEQVRENFTTSDAFKPSHRAGHWMFDMYEEARRQLRALGVHSVTASKHCTYCDKNLFSYRRENRTGRFASLIWLE